MVLPEVHDAALPVRRPRSWLRRAAWAVLAVALLGLFGQWESGMLAPAVPPAQLSFFRLSAYAHIVLFTATVLYVWHLGTASAQAGAWASRLATLGALGLTLALATRWIGTYYLRSPGHPPLNAVYEMMALFSIVTIAFYLIMERVYRTRQAGAFVMPIVLGALLFQVWLIGTGQAIAGIRVPVLRDYLMYAHVLGHVAGYGAFAVAAAMGAAWLVRSRVGQAPQRYRPQVRQFARAALPDLCSIEDSMHKAVTAGFILFGIGIALGVLSAYEAWGRYLAPDAMELRALALWLVYAPYFYLRRVRNWDGARLAWWSLAGFGATLLYYFGMQASWPGWHAIHGG